ncbi:MAG: glycerol-3-phosphate acyltransferase [Candidatus Heimdallarchaeota archaeon]|nr:glycerol-3-phosphate acyltransferase [Candidatus Heimdallarchaeota archaeon]
MITLDVLWAAALGYLLGSIPIAWIVVKLWLKIDIRTVGSKNVGGRNVIRAFQAQEKPKGLAYTVGIIEAILDMLKGFFAMWLAVWISFTYSQADIWVIAFAGPAAILGHNWCIWLWGPGGKGVASTLGTMIFFNPIFMPLWLVLYFVLGSAIMYSAITYLVTFIVMGVIFIFWGEYIWTWVSPANASPLIDLNEIAIFGWVAFATMVAITFVVLSRQGENFRKIKSGEAKKMKLWKIFKGKADEALK